MSKSKSLSWREAEDRMEKGEVVIFATSTNRSVSMRISEGVLEYCASGSWYSSILSYQELRDNNWYEKPQKKLTPPEALAVMHEGKTVRGVRGDAEAQFRLTSGGFMCSQRRGVWETVKDAWYYYSCDGDLYEVEE